MWRIHVPKRQAKVLFLLFLGVLCCGFFICWKYGTKLSIFGFHPPTTLAQYLQISMYFLSLTLAYMITYSAVEADSPSLIMIMRISDAGKQGLPKESLEREIDDGVLIEPRLTDLLVDKMANVHEGRYRLRVKGILMARVFVFYRHMMGAGKGG
jgi:hypothetical protein